VFHPGDRQAQVVGIDLGGTQIKGVLVDQHGCVLRRELRATNDEVSSRGAFTESIRALANDLGSELPIGVSAPGLVRADRRAIGWLPGRLHGLENLDWTEYLVRRSSVPVTNDAHASLLGEAWIGAARGLQSVVMLTLGTGVGGAAMVDGRLLRGHLGRAGHLGHVTMDFRSEERSIVGTPGALECFVGNYNIRERTGGRFETTHALIAAYREGDELARECWMTSIRVLGCAIASFVNVLDPEAVIVGGGIAAAGEALFGPLAAELDRIEWRPGGHAVKLIPAELDEWAGAIGAARAALLDI
jgi:glucokinase